MTERLKLIRLIPVLDFGGVETVFEIWSQFADRERYDLRVCTFWKPGAAADTIRANGIPVDVLDVDPSIRNPRATAALARYLKRMRPDILQASIGEANFHAALIGKACGVPLVVIEEHGVPDRPLPYRLVHAALYRMVDAIIGVSQVAIDYVVTREFAPRHRTYLLYNAIPDQYFDPVTSRSARRDQFRFVTVGRLHPVKNQDRLIQAFAPVARAHREARLMIVGGGDCHADLARRIVELGLEEQVELLGYRSDVRALVEDADCFVLPSLSEAFGIAVVEAMARGIPIIASNAGALPEVVGDVGDRWIVDPLDVDGWSRAMTNMIQLDDDTRAAMGRDVRRIAERYSPARHAASLQAIYDILIARHRLCPSA
jgi:glycosyltransferase involved in cell wall biosynthesis